MPMYEKGFLGNEINNISNKIYENNKGYFDLCYDLNIFAHNTMFELEIHNQNGQEVISASLFIKVLNGFQAIVILTRLGLVIESEILLRSVLEVLFILKIGCEDKDFIPEYIRTDETNRLKLMNIALSNPYPVLDSLRDYATKEIASLKNKVAQENIRELQIEALARRAGLEKQYNTAYRLLSGRVHTNPRSLQEYVTIDNKGDINAFVWGPITKDINVVLLTSAEIIYGAMDLMTKLFKKDKKKELGNFWKRLTSLAT